MAYIPKDWIDGTSHEVQGPSTTNISAAALEDLETRVTDYTDDSFQGGQTQLGITVAPSARIPVNLSPTLTGAGVGTSGSDVVANEFGAYFTGDFSAMAGATPGHVFGMNSFTVTGDAAGDGAGITNLWGALIETHKRSPDGTITNLFGAVGSTGLWGAAAGGTVTNAYSLRANAPQRFSGATGGVITNAYSLFVEKPTVGATVNLTSFFDGGQNRFGATCDISEAQSGIVGLNATAFSIAGGYDSSDPSVLLATGTGWDGSILSILKKAGAVFGVHDNSNTVWSVDRVGIPRWDAAGNQQTTVGAAGGASALPGNPTKYFKIKDSGGTTLVIPAWAAS